MNELGFQTLCTISRQKDALYDLLCILNCTRLSFSLSMILGGPRLFRNSARQIWTGASTNHHMQMLCYVL